MPKDFDADRLAEYVYSNAHRIFVRVDNRTARFSELDDERAIAFMLDWSARRHLPHIVYDVGRVVVPASNDASVETYRPDGPGEFVHLAIQARNRDGRIDVLLAKLDAEAARAVADALVTR
jgi:hypothetical protein